VNSRVTDDEATGLTRAEAIVLALVLLAAVSLVYFGPVLIDPAGRVAGGSTDPMLVAYIVTWVAEHLFTAEIWHPPFFYPAPNVLAYSDHQFGLGLLAWPAVAGAVSPVTMINTMTWLAFVLTSVAVFAWLIDARGHVLPAAAAAVTMTYGAWRMQQLAHLHVIFLPFLPLALCCFARAIERRASAWLIWIGAAALTMQTFFTTSLSVFVLPLVAIWMIATGVAARRREPALWLRLAAALVIVGVINLPIASHYWQLGAGFERSPVEIDRFSVGWRDVLSVPASHWLYGDLLAFTRGSERELFPGIGFLLLAGVGLVSMRAWRPWTTLNGDSARTACWSAFVVVGTAIWASTGPSPSGEITIVHLPYDLISSVVPGGRHVRVPARFFALAAIFIAPIVAAGWQRVYEWIARGVSRPTLAATLTIGLLAITAAEALPGFVSYEASPDLREEALRSELASGAIAFLPLSSPDLETRRMWLARRSGLPVVNGYSGHFSPLWEAVNHFQAGETDEPSRRALYTRLLDAGVDTLIVDAPSDPLVDPELLRPVGDRVFRIPPDIRYPALSQIALGRGAGLLLPESGWSYPERSETDSWVWSLDRRATMAVPMDGTPHREIALRVRSLDRSDSVELQLWWNRRLLGTRPLTREPATVTFPLPEAATKTGWTRFEIVGPEPRRVRGSSEDRRRLGVCVFEVMLR
jgi:hypothetical protein